MNYAKLKFTTCLLLFPALLFPASVLAARVTFEPKTIPATPQENYTVTVLMDTEGESINAIEGTVVIDAALGNPLSVTDSGSVVTYWIARPSWNESSRTVRFSGSVPGGFSGSGILFSVVLPPTSGTPGANALSLVDVRAYRNDGLGSLAKVALESLRFSQSSEPMNQAIADQLFVDDTKKDNDPPEIFSPSISRDERVYDGKWFVTFAASDKQSGVDHYEIQESRSGKIDSGRWKRAESPYLLEDQELHSYVFVIAIDRQGNERVIKIYPRNPLPWTQRSRSMLIAAGGLAVLVSAYYVYYRRRARIQRPGG